MAIRFHPHARQRMEERGATEHDVVLTVGEGEEFSAKHGRTGFRRNLAYGGVWRGKSYSIKQVEAYAVREDGDWLVVTVLVKYF